MDSPFIVPLGVFAAVAIIVALVNMVKLRDREVETHQDLHREEMEHRTQMRVLEEELERVKQGNGL